MEELEEEMPHLMTLVQFYLLHNDLDFLIPTEQSDQANQEILQAWQQQHLGALEVHEVHLFLGKKQVEVKHLGILLEMMKDEEVEDKKVYQKLIGKFQRRYWDRLLAKQGLLMKTYSLMGQKKHVFLFFLLSDALDISKC